MTNITTNHAITYTNRNEFNIVIMPRFTYEAQLYCSAEFIIDYVIWFNLYVCNLERFVQYFELFIKVHKYSLG